MNEQIQDLLRRTVEMTIKERGHINIVIAGRTGAGKSTLINAVFQGNMATTGQGKPVTKNAIEITKEGIPLTIFDTRGLEISAFKETIEELKDLVIQRSNDRDANRHIHVAWLCIQEDGRRVEEAEIELSKMLSDYVSVLVVITKARSDNGFSSEVQKLLPKAKNVVRVRSISETFDDGETTLKPMGLEALIEATSELIPEGKRKALAASQKANLKYKKSQAHKVVLSAATAAAAAGASPIPFSDVAILAPIQVGMLAGITSVFGLELSTGSLSTLVGSAIGVTGATFAGRAIVSNILKLIPGAGTVAGGVVSATTAGAITTTLGEAYIAVLASFFENNPEAQPDVEDIASLLKKKMSIKS